MYVRTYNTQHSNYATPQLWLHICRISSAHCEQLRDRHACICTYVPRPISSSIALSFPRLSCSATSSSHSPTAAWWCLLPLATCWPPSPVQCSTWGLDTENSALSATCQPSVLNEVTVTCQHTTCIKGTNLFMPPAYQALPKPKSNCSFKHIHTYIHTNDTDPHCPKHHTINLLLALPHTHSTCVHTSLLKAGEL